MTATTVERNADFSGPLPGCGTLPVAADTLILKGTLFCRDASGRAVPGSDGSPDAYAVASSTFDNRGGAHGAIKAEGTFGVHGLLYSGTAPKPGEVTFVLDNQTVTLDSDSGQRGVAGICIETKNGKCYVWIGPHVSGMYADPAAAEAAAEEAGEKADALAVVEIPVPLSSFRLSDGAAIPAFSDGVADGFSLSDSEGFGIRFNPDGETPTTIVAAVKLPDDLDASKAVVLNMLASRVGAADTTAALTPHVYRNRPGAAYDAGGDLVTGNTGALAGATKVVTELTKAIDQNGGVAAGDALTITLTPTTALDADDLIIHAVWISATRDNTPS